jgi:26S proteasome regulatory subunit N2
MFDYPPEAEVKLQEVVEKVKTAVLSTTVQAKRRKQAKEAKEKKETNAMDLDPTPTTPNVDREASMVTDEGKGDVDKDTEKESEAATARKKAEKEKVGYELENMSRVLPAQLKYISFPGDRYAPVKKVSITLIQFLLLTLVLTTTY